MVSRAFRQKGKEREEDDENTVDLVPVDKTDRTIPLSNRLYILLKCLWVFLYHRTHKVTSKKNLSKLERSKSYYIF